MKTATKWGLGIIGTFVALSILFTILGFALGWGKTGVDIVSADNVKVQTESIIKRHNDLQVSATNACNALKSEKQSDPDLDATMLESKIVAYSALYERNAAAYKSDADNIFKAKAVMPDGYPTAADIDTIDTSDWCTVTAQIKSLKK